MFDNMTEEQKKAFREISIEMHNATEEAMNEAFETTGWFYRDINWTTLPYFDQMLEMFGVDNYKIIISSVRDDWEGGPFRRGQFLISPQGMQNVNKYLEERTRMPPVFETGES